MPADQSAAPASPILLDAVPADAIARERLQRVLVIKLRHHGDVLLTSPVLTLLRDTLPAAQIDALVYAETIPMLTGHPALSQLFSVDRDWKKRGWWTKMRNEWKLLTALKTRRYDIVINLTESWHGAWLARLLRVPYAVGLHVRGRGGFWKKSFTHLYATPEKANRHTVECNLDALRRIGIRPAPDKPLPLTLVPGAAAKEKIHAWLAESGLQPHRYIVFHPAARWRFKCWPVASCAELIERLQHDGWTIVLTAAPDPAECAMVAAILARLDQAVIDLSGQLTLGELGALIADARIFIGVDSAPMHMAAALNVPAVVMFGPSGELEWGPWSTKVRHRVVCSDRYSCRPCGLDGCGGGKLSDCLTQLPVDAVYAAVREALAENEFQHQ